MKTSYYARFTSLLLLFSFIEMPAKVIPAVTRPQQFLIIKHKTN